MHLPPILYTHRRPLGAQVDVAKGGADANDGGDARGDARCDCRWRAISSVESDARKAVKSIRGA